MCWMTLGELATTVDVERLVRIATGERGGQVSVDQRVGRIVHIVAVAPRRAIHLEHPVVSQLDSAGRAFPWTLMELPTS